MGYLSLSNLINNEFRIVHLKNIIENKFPINIRGNKQVTIIIDDKQLKMLNKNDLIKWKRKHNSKEYPYIFKTDEGKLVRFTDISKNNLGINTSGTCGGSSLAEYTECAVCVIGAYVSVYGNNVDIDKLDSLINYDIGDCDIIEMKDFLIMDNNHWLEVIKKQVNILIKKLNIKSNHIWHRNSDFINGINLEFRKHIKNECSLRIHKDKWNPSDIYISDINLSKFESDNLKELNDKLLKYINSGNVFCVSLKKLSTTPKLDKINFIKPKRLKFIRVQDTGKFDSKDVYIESSIGRLQLRTFLAGTDVQGNVLIKNTNGLHGKIGHGILIHLLNKYIKKVKFYSKSDINDMNELEILSKFKKYYKGIGSECTTEEFELNESRLFTKENKYNFYVSKLQSLQIAYRINKMKTNQHKLITEIFNYAMSRGLTGIFTSAPHYKLY